MEKSRSTDQIAVTARVAPDETFGLERSDSGKRSHSRDSIAEHAYRRFEERGREHGHDLDDWLEAEREQAIPADTDV
jgi:hypothetical protein